MFEVLRISAYLQPVFQRDEFERKNHEIYHLCLKRFLPFSVCFFLFKEKLRIDRTLIYTPGVRFRASEANPSVLAPPLRASQSLHTQEEGRSFYIRLHSC